MGERDSSGGSSNLKCQRCEKGATFHITELTSGKPVELHLCEQCAQEYLRSDSDSAGALGASLPKEPEESSTSADEVTATDKKTCPVCGITFQEFRTAGRLGCPHDYVFFAEELGPLLTNIHVDVEHRGKKSRRHPEGTDRYTELVRLRRELREAVQSEKYEQASILRDQIRTLESAG
jgi:protein arginine kinase activator